jgi:hypothetical protein
MPSPRSPAIVVSVRGRDPLRLVGPGLGALVRAGANHRGQLRIDQCLIDRFGGLFDPIRGIGIA